MTEQEKELLRLVVERIAEAIKPNQILLFGSYARNEQNDDSDIDLLIECETKEPMVRRYGNVRRLLREFKAPFDILVYTPEELAERKKDKHSVVYNAFHDGVLLYEK